MQVRISLPGLTPTTYSLEGCEHVPPINLDIVLPWDPLDIDAGANPPGQSPSQIPGKRPTALSDLDIFKHLGEHAKSAIDSCPALTELLTKIIDFFKKHASLPSPEQVEPPKGQHPPVPQPGDAPRQKDPAAPVAENPEGLQPGNERKVSFVNDGDKPMTLKFTPNAGSPPIPDLVIPPGEGRTVQFPEGWGGNVRSTKGDGAATLVELKFDQDKTWGDVSHIDGSNAYATIQTVGGETRTGSTTNLLEGAPENLILRDANGKPYAIKPSTVSEITDPAVVAYLSTGIGPGQGYKYPSDNLSTTAFGESNLIVHMKDYA